MKNIQNIKKKYLKEIKLKLKIEKNQKKLRNKCLKRLKNNKKRK